MNKIASKPFKHTFLSQFVLIQKLLPFYDDEIKKIDTELAEYEQVFLNPDIEKNLISRNELLASFAISKAENSTLTLQEAQNVYNLLLTNEEYTFISDRLKRKEKLTQKDYDKLEFYNIAKTFRSLNEAPFSIDNITTDDIRKLHQSLSLGLDVFAKYLPDFTVYKSGKFRDNDLIRVGSYIPAPYNEIEKGVEELLLYLKTNKTITGVAVFHTGLYALHPFNNGNKRVCRILEHIFFRDLGLNQKNLYSTSYYYHKQKQRYYKYLLYSLERRNLNHFVSFIQEALVLSMIGVLKLSLASKRSEFLNNQTNDEQILLVLKPLLRRKELQFKNLVTAVRGKMARQTFVNQLQKATADKIVLKREVGRATYYSLNFNAPEEEALIRWLTFAKKKLFYIPDEIKLL
jgi:Fic family protein